MCLLNYGNACQVAEDNLGPNHRISIKFKQIFNDFNKVNIYKLKYNIN